MEENTIEECVRWKWIDLLPRLVLFVAGDVGLAHTAGRLVLVVDQRLGGGGRHRPFVDARRRRPLALDARLALDAQEGAVAGRADARRAVEELSRGAQFVVQVGHAAHRHGTRAARQDDALRRPLRWK